MFHEVFKDKLLEVKFNLGLVSSEIKNLMSCTLMYPSWPATAARPEANVKS